LSIVAKPTSSKPAVITASYAIYRYSYRLLLSELTNFSRGP
jgi:hypothetical protein